MEKRSKQPKARPNPRFSIKRLRQSSRYKRFQKRFLVTVGTLVLVQGVLVTIAAIRNRFFMDTDQYAAVLSSDNFITSYDYWVSPATFFGASPSWTHYFNNRGQKTKWFFWPNSHDLYQVVQDPNCRSIVIVGHGSYHAWRAIDKTISNQDLKPYAPAQNKKQGEWFQLTCATDEGYDCRLGELVMEPNKVYSYHKKVNSLGMVIDGLTGFRYIKSIQPTISTQPESE